MFPYPFKSLFFSLATLLCYDIVHLRWRVISFIVTKQWNERYSHLLQFKQCNNKSCKILSLNNFAFSQHFRIVCIALVRCRTFRSKFRLRKLSLSWNRFRKRNTQWIVLFDVKTNTCPFTSPHFIKRGLWQRNESTDTYTNLEWNWIMSDTMTVDASRRFNFIIVVKSEAEQPDKRRANNNTRWIWERAVTMNVLLAPSFTTDFRKTSWKCSTFTWIVWKKVVEINRSEKKNRAAIQCARFILCWYPLTPAASNERFAENVNYSSRLWAIVSMKAVNNNLHKYFKSRICARNAFCFAFLYRMHVEENDGEYDLCEHCATYK